MCLISEQSPKAQLTTGPSQPVVFHKAPLPIGQIRMHFEPKKIRSLPQISVLFSDHPSPTKLGIQPRKRHYILQVGTFVPHLPSPGIHPSSSLPSHHLSILKVTDIFIQNDPAFWGLCGKYLDCSTRQGLMPRRSHHQSLKPLKSSAFEPLPGRRRRKGTQRRAVLLLSVPTSST